MVSAWSLPSRASPNALLRFMIGHPSESEDIADSATSKLAVSVMITTRNRRDELRCTLTKLRELDPQPAEVIVCADGCTDDTVAMVEREFHSCRLLRNESVQGSVFSRDRLLRLAKCDIVLSLDDDSYPLDQDFISRLKDLFEKYPEAALFSFPEIRDDGELAHVTKSPQSAAHLVSAYANCAAAMRRAVYLRSAGFPGFFVHMYEEPDYALQCYALGFVVRFEPSLRIRHHVSAAQREPIRRHHFNARNELWSAVMRCPFPQVIVVALFRVWRQFRYACSEGFGWAIREPMWWFSALAGVGKCLANRQPVSWKIYYSWMRLARQPEQSQRLLAHSPPQVAL
jgi:GT2 family glycosyltransferase